VASAVVASAAEGAAAPVAEVSTGKASRRSKRRALIGGAVVAAVLIAGGATAWAADSSGNTGYRMAIAVRTSIGQSLSVVGTLEPVSDATAAFQVAGQVTAISVAVGQTVTAGQTLASLDPTSLNEAVSSAQSTLASDEAKLTEDEEAEDSSSTSTSTTKATTTTTAPTAATTTTTAPSHGSGASGAGSGAGGSSGTISQDQTTLVGDQHQTSTDEQQEAADLTQAETTCGTGTPSSSSGPSSTTTTTTSPSTTNSSACAAALQTASNDEQKVSSDEQTVSNDETKLASALNSEQAADSAATPSSTSTGTGQSSAEPTGSSATSATSATSGTKGDTGSADTGTSGQGAGGSGGSAASDSPSQLASDEAAIDTAQADLTNAQQSLNDATLTSPIAGTVVSIGTAVGDTVSADSSTKGIEIIGTQAYEVAGTLTSTQVTSVKVGMPAIVAVDGLTQTITGTVSQVGPVQSSDGSYSYPVVVALPSSVTGLFTGSTADADIETGHVANVLAVPTSAVTVNGTKTYVIVMSAAGQPAEKVVKIGMIGLTYTQILSGLKDRQAVILADLAEPVPSSNTTTLGGFGGGVFVGGGRFAGLGGAGRVTIGIAPGG
jgi:multidrug efflux pump subunit AcrA (membrane-fusion protein)